MIYRYKKIKKYQEGFIEVKNGKLILYDEHKQRIDSIFSKRDLEDGVELDFERNYCVVQDEVGRIVEVQKTVIKPRMPFAGLKKKPLHVRPSETKEPIVQTRGTIRAENVQALNKSTSVRLTLQDVQEPKFNGKELSQNQLLALFNGTATNISNPDSVAPPLETKPGGRFAKYVEEDESTSDENDIISNSKLGINMNAMVGATVEENLAKDHSIISNVTVKHKFNAIPLKPLPIEFRTASNFTNEHPKKVNPNEKTKRNDKKSFRPIKKPRLQQFPNQFGLNFDSLQESRRLYRSQEIPTFFKSIDAYKMCWKNAIVETLNLSIADVASKFAKLFPNAKTNIEGYMRSNRVSFYTKVTLRSMERDSSVQYSTDADRIKHVALDLQNKEHHSAYSKGKLTS
jgi:hypothetical protein